MPDINMQVFEEVRRNQLVTEVDIQTQVTLDNYQVQLSDIANPTQSQDNIVIDRHGEFLPHWNESLDFDTWVKMSMEIAGKRILMLRGNSNVNSASSAKNTFIVGDDFNDESIDTSIWPTTVGTPTESGTTIVTNKYTRNTAGQMTEGLQSAPLFIEEIIIEWKQTVATGNGQVAVGYSPDGNDIYFGYNDTGMNVFVHGNNNIYGASEMPTETNTIIGTNDGNSHNYKMWWDGDKAHWQVDNGTVYDSVSLTTTPSNWKVYFGNNGYDENVLQTLNWIFVREYTSTEPIWTADSAEQNIAVALKSLGRAG